MYNQYNVVGPEFNSLISIFKGFLHAEKISKGSTRSYISDVRHFLGWLTFFLESNGIIDKDKISLKIVRGQFENDREDLKIIDLLKHVNGKVLDAYKTYQTSNSIPLKTINRRFSSLRRFGVFCKSQNWIPSTSLGTNPFDTLKNISLSQPFPEDKCHLAEFKTKLWKKGASKLTIKNYLNDIKQFLSWSGKQR